MQNAESIQPRYAALSERIAEGRAALGLSQAEFAAELGVKQQAVSRWEAGTHRPRQRQVSALARLMNDEVPSLMQLAEYTKPVGASFSNQFPVEALDWEAFEQFVAQVVQYLHPEADVRIQGTRGHKQGGTDVVASFPDGRRWSFQCRRVERFGPKDAEKAIADHSFAADRAFVVLSKIASPSVFEAVDTSDGWTLWDKQVLTVKIRTLPMDAQERLVDTFFRGQRMALLGRNEPGPWLTIDEFFAPFKGRAKALSHDWPLVGRDHEIDSLMTAIGRTDSSFALLLGAGGIGKTRTLKEAIERYIADNKSVVVRFLSNFQEPDAGSLGALGSGRKLLIVDDAHDREGLKLLIEFAVKPVNKTKLLVVTRPYAEQRITDELALYSVIEPPTVKLERLSKEAVRNLVKEVLREFDGHPGWADHIVAVAGDNPLVAAVAARVFARDDIVPELATNKREARDVVLARFRDIVAGDIGGPADTGLLRAVLSVLALIQPFQFDDRRILGLVQLAHPDASTVDVSRALKKLIDGGVVYRRGQLFRLMPDLLGDFLIEESCVAADGQLNQFALGVARAVDGQTLAQVLINLGRLDWRRTEGDPSESDLLGPIWRELRNIECKYDPRISMVQEVAYYQPRQALAFVQAQIERGNFSSDFCSILKRVVYGSEHRRDALRLLWELGQNDSNDQNRDLNHPIRTLAEIISYDAYKPVAFIEEVAEFGFELLDDPAAWTGCNTPFDVLAPLLRGQGMETTSNGRTISMTPFFVEHDHVAPLRAQLIDKTLTLLNAANPATACKAATFLNDALRPPMGAFNSKPGAQLLRQYKKEFNETVEKIGKLIERGTLAATTLICLIKSLDWYAEFDDGALGIQVRQIFESLPTNLDFRLHAAMSEGADHSFVGQVCYADWDEECDWLKGLIDELLSAYPSASSLCTVIVKVLDALKAAGISAFPSYELIGTLVDTDPAIGRCIVEHSLNEPGSTLVSYLGYAVGSRLESDPDDARPLVRDMLRSSESAIRFGGVRSLIAIRREPEEADVELLREALLTQDPKLVPQALHALRSWSASLGAKATIGLISSVEFDKVPGLLQPVCELLCSRRLKLLDQLRESDAELLVERMKGVSRLDDHWTAEVLSRLAHRFGMLVARFVLARVDLALDRQVAQDFIAVSYSQRRMNLALHASPRAEQVLEYSWRWVGLHSDVDGSGRYLIGCAFAAMFKLDSALLVGYFDALLDRATINDLGWIGQILRHSDHRFVFQHQGFVERYLSCCKAADINLLQEVTSHLYGATMHGHRSGAVGEPFPRDLETRDRAKAVLVTMSRLSPAYALYRNILEGSERSIAESIAEGRALDAEE